MSKVYIAGPMRGIPLFNFPAFDGARDLGRARGWDVTSPADLDRTIDGLDETAEKVVGQAAIFPVAHYAARDLAVLLSFRAEDGDAIALLPGWERSVGARAERAVAVWLGLRVLDARTFNEYRPSLLRPAA